MEDGGDNADGGDGSCQEWCIVEEWNNSCEILRDDRSYVFTMIILLLGLPSGINI